MNWHLILGWISSILFIMTLWGSAHQISIFSGYIKKRDLSKFSNVTLSYFFAYFFSVFLFFSYAAFLTPRDYFIFSTRGFASALAIITLYLVWRGTNQLKYKVAFSICGILLAIVLSLFFSGVKIPRELYESTKFLIICVMAYVVYSYIAQVKRIYKSKSSEGISKIMNFTVIMKDIGTVLYALTFSLSDSWPIMMQGAVNGFFRFIVLMFCIAYSRSRDEIIS